MREFRLLILFLFPALGLSAQDTIRLAMVGDIMPATSLHKDYKYYKDNTSLFIDAIPIFQEADLVMGNLETTLADDGTPRNAERKYMFLTPTKYGQLLREAGFDYLSLANNHTYDFGEEGVASTIKTLRNNNISFGGLKRQPPFCMLKVGERKVAVCAFGFNFYCNDINDSARVVNIIKQAKAQADIVVVSFHGGAEGKAHRNLPRHDEGFMGENRGDLRSFAHLCIDNGADIVYGHGPHVVRAIEMYKERLIAYSLGNFCTPYGVSITGINGYAPILLLNVDKDGKLIFGRIYSMLQHRGKGPRLDSKNTVLREFISLSDSNIANGAMNITSTGHIIPSEYVPTSEQLLEQSEEYY